MTLSFENTLYIKLNCEHNPLINLYRLICTKRFQPLFFLQQQRSIMEIFDQLSPFVENIGFPALIFAIWYIYHQAQVKAFEKIIQNNFEILKDLLETNQYHAALLSRIESKIDNNLWCPLLKKEVN